MSNPVSLMKAAVALRSSRFPCSLVSRADGVGQYLSVKVLCCVQLFKLNTKYFWLFCEECMFEADLFEQMLKVPCVCNYSTVFAVEICVKWIFLSSRLSSFMHFYLLLPHPFSRLGYFSPLPLRLVALAQACWPIQNMITIYIFSSGLEPCSQVLRRSRMECIT